MVNYSGKLMRVAMTAGLVLLIIGLARIGLADFMRLGPAAYLDSIRAANALPSPDKLVAARERLLIARALDSDNPIIPEYLGQIAFYGAALSRSDAQLQWTYLSDALGNYEVALALRPNSGYLWASLMLTRQALLDIPKPASGTMERATFEDGRSLGGVVDAMRHAAQLAPWEPGIVEQVIWVGTMHYAELSPRERDIVDGACARGRKLGLKVSS